MRTCAHMKLHRAVESWAARQRTYGASESVIRSDMAALRNRPRDYRYLLHDYGFDAIDQSRFLEERRQIELRRLPK